MTRSSSSRSSESSALPSSARRRRLRIILSVLLLVGLIGSLFGASAAFAEHNTQLSAAAAAQSAAKHARVLAAEHAENQAVAAHLAQHRADVTVEVEEARGTLAGFQATRDAAVGKAPEETINALSAALDGAAATLAGTDRKGVAALTVAPVASAAQAVSDAVAAWEVVEAERIAAEEAAAAAAEAATSNWSPAAAGSSGTPGVDYSAYSYLSGFQSELDMCDGAVNLTGSYGVSTIGQHWSCGGSGFPTWGGATVQLTGNYEGTYRVIGIAARLSASGNDTGDIPGGYDLLFQTCWNGNSDDMIFVALERI